MKEETKSAVGSKGVQGSLVTIVGAVLTYLELAGKLPMGGASPLVVVFGGVYSLFGRLFASKKIDSIF